MSITTINSDYKITDIDNNFKVSAGPGAGKTYWLVNHIKNILHNSDKLSITRRVACITYTNTAVETIYRRLGTSSAQVEVSTIHSFLYKHIVKPYVSFIAEEYNIDISKVDGHDEIKTSFKKVSNWIEGHPNYSILRHPFTFNQLTRLQNNKTALINWFNSIAYNFNPTNNDIDISLVRSEAYYIEGNDRRYLNRTCLNALEHNLIEYKKQYWNEGKVSHDDVLFFSFQLLKKFPFISEVLSAKFPYLVIDEFQDSNPIQLEIFKTLGLSGIKTGVIGDPIQSIYGFQGANHTQFNSFILPNLREYTLNENRRSSNEIIDVLNSIRTDISQVKYRNASIEKPIIFIGDITTALQRAKERCVLEDVQTLSRSNFLSNALKAEINGVGLDSKLLEKLLIEDSNRNRKYLIHSCIKSIAYARENKFKDSIKELEKIFNYKNDKLKGKRKALEYITLLLDNYNVYKDLPLLDFANFVKENLDNSISKVSGGRGKVFYENQTFNQLSLCVSIPEDLSLHKTIHKSKGDEFKNVLLVLKKENDINFLINPNLANTEEQRINYVAVSRAQNKLFISIPTLSEDKQEALNNLFDIEII
ncbi:UvrD-helicase domain-containing protein [Cellulophaga sp. Z1A5H]|uniref:UvrD-helicase domain-containing protein n=1 Tax=Cellulophaga sp. Z1A5H TaxID=2687291 RepID=UPI0013FDDBFE|nr:ATP-dependent helicase [Cellulophaga sp. Z1A5H]